MTTISLLIVDDHPLAQSGMQKYIEESPIMAVAGLADDGVEAVEQAQALEPDVVIMDLEMPKMNGVEATELIMQMKNPPKVLVVSALGSEPLALKALKAGAVGYLLKHSSPLEITEAIERVHQGSIVLSPTLAEVLDTPPISSPTIISRMLGNAPTIPSLTPREHSLLRALVQTDRSQELSQLAGLSERSVDTYVSRLNKKFGTRTRTHLVLRAMELGIIEGVGHSVIVRTNTRDTA